MTWTVTHNSKLQIIEVVYTGITSGEDLQESTSKAIAMTKEFGISEVLVEITDITLDVTTMDIFKLPAHQYRTEQLDYRTHVALILPCREKERQDALFYETVCLNRGWLVRTFETRDESIAWLKGQVISASK